MEGEFWVINDIIKWLVYSFVPPSRLAGPFWPFHGLSLEALAKSNAPRRDIQGRSTFTQSHFTVETKIGCGRKSIAQLTRNPYSSLRANGTASWRPQIPRRWLSRNWNGLHDFAYAWLACAFSNLISPSEIEMFSPHLCRKWRQSSWTPRRCRSFLNKSKPSPNRMNLNPDDCGKKWLTVWR